MQASDAIARGQQVMTVCNACRYCEQFCPVFPAMELRTTFTTIDLEYLANLCHNCGECLYACQYAPPHEFGIDVPRTLARIRLRSYEEYCWPESLASAFRRRGVGTSLLSVLVMTSALLLPALWQGTPILAVRDDFYAIVPHGTMVAIFGAVFAFVVVALAISVARFRREVGRLAPAPTYAHMDVGAGFSRPAIAAARDILTLRHLHATGVDCVSGEERRSPWRRWWHHCTFYGFALCFASTAVAAVYHALGWAAPYAYRSLPVVLGAAGGLGLVIGPVGLWALRGRRDPALSDPEQRGMDEAFMLLLVLTSSTGLVLLALRQQPFMGLLLLVHLGSVLALFVSLPYGKFVHGLYRAVALARYAREEEVPGGRL